MPTVKMPGGGFAIICTRGRGHVKRCSFEGCDQPGDRLCDWKAGGKTCDKPICRRHGLRIAKDVDFCINHPR